MNKKTFKNLVAIAILLLVGGKALAQEPYAVLSNSGSNLTLTLYYDDQKTARNGFSVGPVTEDHKWERDISAVYTVKFDPSFKDYTELTSTAYWFYGCTKIINIGTINSYLVTENVTDMSYMFYGCASLSTLNLNNLNTEKVTDMSYMFYNCSQLQTLNVSGFNTENVTDMSYMFYNCKHYNLSKLDLSSFNTKNVTNMRYMFYCCSHPKVLDMTGFHTENVTDMQNMFYGCEYLTQLDVSKFNTEKVTNMRHMFYGCKALTNLDVSGFNTSNVTDMRYMFSECNLLTKLEVGGFDTRRVKNMQNMFYGCKAVEELDVSHFVTDSVTNMASMFNKCESVKTLDVSHFNTENVTDMSSMFYNCKVSKIDVSHFNTSKVTNMTYMFNNCTNLTEVDLSNFNTEKLQMMDSFIEGCDKITLIDLSSFSTASLPYSPGVAVGAKNLTTVFINPEFVNPNWQKNYFLFRGCRKLHGGLGSFFYGQYDNVQDDRSGSACAIIDQGHYKTGYYTYKPAPATVKTYFDNSQETAVDTWDGTVADSFAGGTGTEDDPYLIATGAQLAYLAQVTANNAMDTDGKFYRLTADIVLNDTVLNNDYLLRGTPQHEWTPIGNTNNPFRGDFNGTGHRISGAYVKQETDGVGLFGVTVQAHVHNIALLDSYIEGKNYTGAIVGGLSGSDASASHIRYCYAEAYVKGEEYVGGIAGHINFACGVLSCYSTGRVGGTHNVAGLVGHSNRGGVTHSFSTCRFDEGGSNRAGCIGQSYEGGFYDIYFDNTISPSIPVVGMVGWTTQYGNQNDQVTGLSTEKMQEESFATTMKWPFVYANGKYPYIMGMPKVGEHMGDDPDRVTITVKDEETGTTIKAEVSEPEEEGEEPTATVTEVELAEGQTAVVVPDSINGFVVNEIGEGFAKDNKDITEVVLPEVISTIGEEAFSGCENIQGEMDLTNVTEIGDGAFHDCIGIEEFHFGQDAENITIGEGAFTQTTLEGKEVVLDADIYIPAGQRDEYREKFGKEEGDPLYPYFQEESEKIFEEFKDEESGMEFVGKVDTEGNGSWSITDGTTVEGNYEVPEQIFDEPIVGIGDGAFKDNMALTGVELNNRIKFIGDDAFNGCENLTGDVDLGNVTEIGDNAFQGCDGVKEFNFGQNAAELNIGKGAFTKIVIDENSGEQQEQALNAEIILPPTQREDFRDKFGGEIGKPLKPYFDLESEKVFEEYKPEDGTEFKGSIDLEGQSSWTLIDGSNYAGDLVAPHTLFEEPVVGIGDEAFKDNMALTGVELNNRIRFIGDDAFNGCENIQDEVVLESSMSIGDYAFNDCNKLDDIIIKEKAENMQFGRYPFCKDLAAMARAQAPEAGTVPEPLNARIFVPVGELENYRTRFAQTEQDPLWPNFQIDKVFEGDPTGIYAIGLPGNQKAANTVYDLQGRKISNQTYRTTNLPKGIYIINGRKYIK